jgi:hypothetical protein
MKNMMNKEGRKISFGVVALLAVTCAFTMQSLAQDEAQQGQAPKFFVAGPGGASGAGMAMQGMPLPGSPASDVTYQFISSEMSFDGNVVKGAPFSAEASTESTQVLADGNRITHKNTATLYRDAEGRTRREQTLGSIGPWTASGTPPQIISINDPVAGVNYVLDANTHTARKLPSLPGKAGAVAGATMGKMMIMIGPGGMAPGGATESVAVAGPGGTVAVGGPGAGPVTVPPLAPGAGMVGAGPGPGPVFTYRQMTTAGMQKSDPPQTESLGQQNLGGVTAQGTRTTLTIPAGQIGNELPIQVVSERWYSPDLMMVVMTKNSDPRFGTTVYQLNNIRRDAPAASLFEVPPDYTVQDAPGPGNFFQQRIVK